MEHFLELQTVRWAEDMLHKTTFYLRKIRETPKKGFTLTVFRTSEVVPNIQKQPSRNAKQLYWNRTLAWVFSCKFAAIFRTPFSKNTSEGLLLNK